MKLDLQALSETDVDADTLSIFIKYKKEILKYIEQAEEYFLHNVHPNIEVSMSKGRRTWIDDEQAVATALANYGIEPYKKSLVGITAAERVMPKEALLPLVTLSEGKSVLSYKQIELSNDEIYKLLED